MLWECAPNIRSKNPPARMSSDIRGQSKYNSKNETSLWERTRIVHSEEPPALVLGQSDNKNNINTVESSVNSRSSDTIYQSSAALPEASAMPEGVNMNDPDVNLLLYPRRPGLHNPQLFL